MAFVKVEMIGKVQSKRHENGGDKKEGSRGERDDKTGGSNHNFDSESDKLNYKRENSHVKHLDSDHQFNNSEDEVFIGNYCRGSPALSFHVECASNDKIQQQQEGSAKRIEWKGTTASVGTAVEPESDMQSLRSAYLYDRDPLRDPRFTRLVDQLVPLRTSLSVDRTKMVDAKRRAKEKFDVICFKDICLNETCRLVYKIMSKGKENS